MNRPRVLLLLLTTLAVTFGGVTSAAATSTMRDRGPEIISVSDVFARDKHPDKVWVEVKYRCEGRDDQGTLELVLRQRSNGGRDGSRHQNARYESDRVWASCDGERHRQWVTLWRSGDRRDGGFVHNGDAKLRVTLTEKWGDEVSETFWVRVKGAGHDDNGHNGH
jgi:hypothetical protein